MVGIAHMNFLAKVNFHSHLRDNQVVLRWETQGFVTQRPMTLAHFPSFSLRYPWVFLIASLTTLLAEHRRQDSRCICSPSSAQKAIHPENPYHVTNSWWNIPAESSGTQLPFLFSKIFHLRFMLLNIPWLRYKVVGPKRAIAVQFWSFSKVYLLS